jgi:hypothetical protein
MYDPHHTHTNV